MRRPSRSQLVLGALAAAALALAWLVLRPAPQRVDVARATLGPLQVTVDEEGETRVRERFVVAAPTTGRLLRMALDEGDRVEAGQLVARIEPVPLDPRDRASAEARLQAAQANKSAAEARVALARAALEQARRNAGRADRLREAGTLSQEAYEAVQLEATRARQDSEAARFAADAADHEVEAARAALIASSGRAPAEAPAPDGGNGSCAPNPCVLVHAPVSGSVLRIHEESERTVVAGTPLLSLGDPGALEIVVDVLSTDAVQVRPGALVLVEDWGGDGALRARVRRIEPSAFTKISALGVEEQRVNVIADLLDESPGLGDGFRVEARIVTWQADQALQVPASALFRRGDAWVVFVVEGGVARVREVGVGPRSRTAVEIRDGLREGDTVVLHPGDRLHDGVRVEPL